MHSMHVDACVNAAAGAAAKSAERTARSLTVVVVLLIAVASVTAPLLPGDVIGPFAGPVGGRLFSARLSDDMVSFQAAEHRQALRYRCGTYGDRESRASRKQGTLPDDRHRHAGTELAPMSCTGLLAN